MRAFALALLKEIQSYKNIKAKTLYLGGGTPTTLPIHLLKEIISSAKENFSLSPDAEISVEANPETIDEEKLKALRELGVNRISIGVQSFDDDLLRFLGRVHNADKARKALEKAREAGFENINIDLLFAIPGQTLQNWKETLEEALFFKPTHISCYSLTIEEGTKLFKDLKRGKISSVEDEISAKMFELGDEILTSNGYIHYEISNYSLPGFECQHNLSYWRDEPYLGLGPSAVSFLPPYRLRNHSLSGYLRGKKRILEEIVEEEEREKERIILGLRLKEGVEKERLKRGDKVEEMIREGFMEEENGRIRLTLKGMLVYNSIVADLL